MYLELFPLCMAGQVIDEQGWTKLNFDSGCASSVIPRSWSTAIEKPNGRQFKTANGQIIDDEGLGEIVGKDEWGRPLRMRGRRADVAKPLIAASSMLTERIGILLRHGQPLFSLHSLLLYTSRVP